MTMTKPELSDEHLEALARGRTEAAALRPYLKALADHKPRRGRRRTIEKVESEIADIESVIGDLPIVERLEAHQRLLDLEAERVAMLEAEVDLPALEAEFVRYAAGYAERKGISYQAFRMCGVPAAVLKRAGIPRTGGIT